MVSTKDGQSMVKELLFENDDDDRFFMTGMAQPKHGDLGQKFGQLIL